jgi:hypothetical protein
MPSDSTKKWVSDARVFTLGAKGLKISATVSAFASGFPALDASNVIGTDIAKRVKTSTFFILITLATKD